MKLVHAYILTRALGRGHADTDFFKRLAFGPAKRLYVSDHTWGKMWDTRSVPVRKVVGFPEQFRIPGDSLIDR